MVFPGERLRNLPFFRKEPDSQSMASTSVVRTATRG
jgi:hypothetical protein